MSVVLKNNNNLVVSKQKPPYNRPSDWLTLNDLNETDEKFVGLYGVFSGDSNYVAIRVQGDYTVDWGDGTIENFNSSVLAEHGFVYGNISNSTLTTDGYKQVIITITPQNNQHITYIDFQNTPTIYSGNGFSISSNWLEVKMSLNYISEFYFSSQSNIRHRFLNAFIWQGSENFIFISSLSYFFNECVDLEYVKFFNCSSGDYNSIFADCRSIKTIEGNFTFTTPTSFANVFRNCYTLQKLPNIILNSGVSIGSFTNAFQNCYNLTNLDLSSLLLSNPLPLSVSAARSIFDPPKINFSGFSQIFFTFGSSGIQYLTSDYVFGNTNWGSLFNGANNLMTLPSFNVSGVTSYTNMFNNSFGNLLKCQIFNINTSINFSNRRLGKIEIVEIFNNLTDRTSTTSANINITSCFGAFYLTASDRRIATNKNWTITG